MKKCKECGSYAVNPHCHGREEGIDLDLCDVCYWRKRVSDLDRELATERSLSFRNQVAELELQLAAERERCAAICEKYAGLGGVIAAAIRKGETK